MSTVTTDVRVAGRIGDALALIGRHWPGTADPGRVAVSTTHTTPASKPPMPAAVLSLRREVTDALASTVRMVAEERDLRGPASTAQGAASVPALLSWLSGHVEWLASPQQPDRPEATAHELEQLARRVREVALQQRPSVVEVGPCPEDAAHEDGAHCGGMLRATVRATDDLLPSMIRCTHDATHAWPPRQWEDVAGRVNGVRSTRAWLTVADAATLSGIPERTIRRWVAEGKVTRWEALRPALVSVLEVVAVRDSLAGQVAAAVDEAVGTMVDRAAAEVAS